MPLNSISHVSFEQGSTDLTVHRLTRSPGDQFTAHTSHQVTALCASCRGWGDRVRESFADFSLTTEAVHTVDDDDDND